MKQQRERKGRRWEKVDKRNRNREGCEEEQRKRNRYGDNNT